MVGDSSINRTSILLNNGTYFKPAVLSAAKESQIELVDITDDGKWILVVELNGKVTLVNY